MADPNKVKAAMMTKELVLTSDAYFLCYFFLTFSRSLLSPIKLLNSLYFGNSENVKRTLFETMSSGIFHRLPLPKVFCRVFPVIIIVYNLIYTSTMEKPKSRVVFLVEHMEPYLFEWCLYEYKAMKEYLKGFQAHLWITNARVILQYQGKNKQENLKHLKELEESFSEDKSKYKLVEESLEEFGKTLEGRVCMLDMRGEKELCPDEDWDFIVFGGILGDHPPRDRPAPLRQHFTNIRHLGQLQLATDTAVLISRLILFNKIGLKAIPMVTEPTVKGKNKEGLKTTVQMEGFSYVSKALDIKSGQFREGLASKEKKQIYMSEGVHRLLLQQDLDPNCLM